MREAFLNCLNIYYTLHKRLQLSKHKKQHLNDFPRLIQIITAMC